MTDRQPLDIDSDLRLVVLMRHGEATPTSGSGDEGRGLTDRGRHEAERAGRWLVAQGVRPDVAVVSSSTRTQETWAALQAGGVEAGEVRIDRAVYNGSVGDLLEAVAALPDSATVCLLVGHAPAVPDLATSVATRCRLPQGWSAATLGVLSHGGGWDEFPGEDTVLVACHEPDGV